MVPIVASVPTLAVASVYCLWTIYCRSLQGRTRVLRQRVVYMLWAMAADTDATAPVPAGEVFMENPFYCDESGTEPNRVQVSAGQ